MMRIPAPYTHAGALRTAACSVSFVAVALLLAGCSGTSALDPIATGSISAPPAAYAAEPVPKGVAPEDWMAARKALAEALVEKDAAPSVPWENYVSATRGTVTPLSKTADAGGGHCREFLMSFVKESGEEWLQGAACRTKTGWKVDQARLLERS
ncbi:RT0821/Lpp0805 family surface protein [Ancylobacter sp. SL191]|uniref:RT0821/Lpp0805 family surface protein n=1 Tax=Ancylobacter sp. SL191 TaxID=2995166 RepID=UPI002271EDE2|nr:RT0821/Lpp0805 family surface protein [Ancylobacter sp. SL191]WAC28131.1 RT0821/Lpp0805 family surface protein [Ancylobacter sp. SL191]